VADRPLTESELAELDRLAKTATPGPWVVTNANSGWPISIDAPESRGPGAIGAVVRRRGIGCPSLPAGQANAAFIAAARQAVPRLLADLAEARKERDEAKALAVKWQRIRTPTHGTCCTCQRCGQFYDDCRCNLDEACDEVAELRASLAARDARIAELEKERDRYHDTLLARHGGECIALLGELDEEKRKVEALEREVQRSAPAHEAEVLERAASMMTGEENRGIRMALKGRALAIRSCGQLRAPGAAEQTKTVGADRSDSSSERAAREEEKG